jgi:hypothetical protein
VASGSLSGIELRYHSKNAEQPVSVDDFTAPYQHWQVLLKDKGIDVYKTDSSETRLRARADLEADYNQYLISVNREKPIEAIQHDMTVLETVRSLRTNARNTLDAGCHLFERQRKVRCAFSVFGDSVAHKRGSVSCRIQQRLQLIYSVAELVVRISVSCRVE